MTSTVTDSRLPFRRGLSEGEAAARLKRYGPNRLEAGRSRSLADVVLGTLKEPMFLLLLGGALLYMLLGDFGQGLFLLAGGVATIALVVVQEARSARALAALRRLAEPVAIVIRDGTERRIQANELVPDDLVLIGEGERVPADAILVGGDALVVDESALTGESVPVTKQPASSLSDVDYDALPGGDGAPLLFAGTLTVRGQGVASVTRTGASTRLGTIGASLVAIVAEPSLLQKTTGRLVSQFGGAALAFCVLVVLAYGLVRGDWANGALAGITLGISLVPEEFPMVLAIFMAMGAWRLAQHQVLVRRPAVIETLGAASLLCVDKTGTLTENRMKLATLWREGRRWDLSEGRALPVHFGLLLETAILASAVHPVDPMDRAIREEAELAGGNGSEEPARTYPLRPERLAFIQVWRRPDGLRLAAKGAPETIFHLCRLSSSDYHGLDAQVRELASQGLRVLGVASAELRGEPPEDPGALTFTFEGLIGFMDPIRPEAPAALEETRRAGVSVAMITGDYPATALEIARAAGIDTQAGTMTGAEIAASSDEDLSQRIRHARVFARVTPDQKLRLVQAFKANGEIVAMTGDGVNDAPALEAAHIGIAMGLRGTDVAREAADVVLLDDRFASIVAGVRLGRRIFANLRKALTYIVAVHVPTAGLALLPILVGLPPILYPVHVVLLELLIDPLCALVFEGEPSEKRAMDAAPRDPNETLFGLRQMAIGVLEGVSVLAGVMAVYVAALRHGEPETQARAIAFIALVVGNLTMAIATSLARGANPFDRRHGVFWIIGTAATFVLAAALAIPPLARLLYFATPPAHDLLLAVGAGVAAGCAVRLLRTGYGAIRAASSRLGRLAQPRLSGR